MQCKEHWARRLVLAVAVLCLCATAQADVRLPHVFGSHMVLQRDQALPVWGWADAGEKITVQLGDGAPVKNTIVLDDVLVGEVWLCSGQSNMQGAVANTDNAHEEIAAANLPEIRHIAVPRVPAGFPADDFNGDWRVCSPETVGSFTAAGFYFARYLQPELNVPIGLINSSWGGTLIEPWTPPVGYARVPALDDILQRVTLTNPTSAGYKTVLAEYITQTQDWLGKARQALADEAPLEPAPAYPAEIAPFTDRQDPTALCNSMICPLVPYAIRGAIWYQGESNHGDGMVYADKMKALVGGWRTLWNQGDFPFYYVQIAPYGYGTENAYILPTFWEAQTAALEIPNTGMAVINDIGNLTNIHPTNKQDVGKRLALLALKRTYGRAEVVDSGPTFKSMSIDGRRIIVQFDNVGSGLASRDGKPLDWFEIIGMETDFVKADAVIEGDTVVLTADEVKQPAAMRFAWHKTAEPNLMNKEGLPAWPFRAGEVPERDYLALNVDEAKDYKLVYAFDVAKAAGTINYDEDNRDKIAGPFDRIAYFLELQTPGESTEYVYVSMDAFTDDLGKIGVPALATKAKFQQKVSNMNVVSNVEAIVTGTGLTGGNIEFWPHNYGPPNGAAVPNASATVWDFGDQPGDPENGYGCMQVHNYEAKQTIFAINHWAAGGGTDVGIGNSDGDTRDWTFAANAGNYHVKKLRVLVRPTAQ